MTDDTRIITFAGQDWVVKSGSGRGPGPNAWSDSEQSVWVDQQDRLHLRIREENGIWYSAEIYSKACTPYGLYRFFTIGQLDNLDPNVIFAPFLYKDDETEIDIEFTRWGQAQAMENAQYVIQPHDTPGNLERFQMDLRSVNSTHLIDWQPDSIRFTSLQGHHLASLSAEDLIYSWTYTGEDIPIESEGLRVHINLWLNRGNPPVHGQETEVIISALMLPPP